MTRRIKWLSGTRSQVVSYTGDQGEPVVEVPGRPRIMTGEFPGGVPVDPGSRDDVEFSVSSGNLSRTVVEGLAWSWGSGTLVLRLACLDLPEGVSSVTVSFLAYDSGMRDLGTTAEVVLAPGTRRLVHFSRTGTGGGYVEATVSTGMPT